MPLTSLQDAKPGHISRRTLLTGFAGVAGAFAVTGPGALATGSIIDAGTLGILPDPARDQGPAISRALDSATGAGKALFLPPGRYAAANISLPDGAHLTGARGQSVLLGLGDAPVIRAQGARNITVSNLDFDGRLAAPADIGGLVLLEGCEAVRMRDCSLRAANAPLLHLRGSSGTISDNLLEQGMESALFALDSTGLRIAGNTVRDMADNGILVWRSTGGEDGTIVTGNAVARVGNRSGGNGQWGNGIGIFRAGNVIAANNRITDCKLSAIRNHSGANCQIINNNAVCIGETGIFVEFAFSGAIVANNIIDGASSGLSVTNYNDGGRLATVTGNLVRNLYRDPTRAQGQPQAFGIGIAVEADTVVSGNVIEDAPWIGLVLGYGPYLNDVIASDNIIRGGEYGIGISIVDGAGKAVIRGNLISGASKGAIIGFDHDTPVTGDLTTSDAGQHPHLTVLDNITS